MKKGTIISLVSGMIGGAVASSVYFIKKNRSINDFDKVKKFKTYYNMLNQWLMLRSAEKKLEEYFINHDYQSVAIYGMGEMGERFLEEINQSENLSVKYAIDRESDGVLADIEIKTLDDELEPVDVIVVTAIFAYEEIKKQLIKKTNTEIISLTEVIQELL